MFGINRIPSLHRATLNPRVRTGKVSFCTSKKIEATLSDKIDQHIEDQHYIMFFKGIVSAGVGFAVVPLLDANLEYMYPTLFLPMLFTYNNISQIREMRRIRVHQLSENLPEQAFRNMVSDSERLNDTTKINLLSKP